MMQEIFLIILSPYPFFNRILFTEIMTDYDDFETVYELNDILLLFQFVRIYFVIRVILFDTGFLDGRS